MTLANLKPCPPGGCDGSCNQGRTCLNSFLATRHVLRFCNGGERVENGKTATACSYCSSGVCRQMETCVTPPAPVSHEDNRTYRRDRMERIKADPSLF
jgi:hypothetical protein